MPIAFPDDHLVTNPLRISGILSGVRPIINILDKIRSGVMKIFKKFSVLEMHQGNHSALFCMAVFLQSGYQLHKRLTIIKRNPGETNHDKIRIYFHRIAQALDRTLNPFFMKL